MTTEAERIWKLLQAGIEIRLDDGLYNGLKYVDADVLADMVDRGIAEKFKRGRWWWVRMPQGIDKRSGSD